jgi:putative flavoprotein involved in K+ transport
MTTRVQTLIVGAGQAGLAISRSLTSLGHDHLVVDRGHVGERWRSERWDSFTLLTPNWQTRLPGFQYAGGDPAGFMTRDQVVGFLSSYARSFDAPVHAGVTVTGVDPAPLGWLVHTDVDRYHATNVVIATGHYDRPLIPPQAADLPRSVHQVHTTDYRNPERLPSGAVLVVGAGPSGQQIADELACAGRKVFIAVGRHRPLPRRYRGHDVYWWMDRMGMLDRTVDTLPEPGASRNAPSAVLAGQERDLNLHRLVEHGVVPTGRLRATDRGRVHFDDDLPVRLAEADHNVRRLQDAVDTYVERYGVDAPVEEVSPPASATWAHQAPRTLDLARAGVTTVIWATGYDRDYSWINAPVFDAKGEPVQSRGVTAAPGLFFLGLRWLHRRKSNLIGGVGDDAEHLAEVIASGDQAVREAVA